jgi:hypothetical protein
VEGGSLHRTPRPQMSLLRDCTSPSDYPISPITWDRAILWGSRNAPEGGSTERGAKEMYGFSREHTESAKELPISLRLLLNRMPVIPKLQANNALWHQLC